LRDHACFPCFQTFWNYLSISMKKHIFCAIFLGVFPLASYDAGLAATYVAGHEVAREDVLRSIPVEYIDAARTGLHIAYQHTSHGTHVTRGMLGLAGYKPGDDLLFGVKFTSMGRPTASSGTEGDGLLDFHDFAINTWPYNRNVPDASDLSVHETAFVELTANYLDDPANRDINVVMWSWCNIAGRDVAGNYLPGMQSLIDRYGPNGSKLLSGERAVPVTFIFMTGHPNQNNNEGDGKPGDQAEIITEYCRTHGYFCLDYYSIDTHDLEGNSWPDAGDDGNSSTGGDFYRNWQDEHLLGTDWFENRRPMDGRVVYGAHNSQHITANRKAYAMWWILARIAGWDPDADPDAIDGASETAEPVLEPGEDDRGDRPDEGESVESNPPGDEDSLLREPPEETDESGNRDPAGDISSSDTDDASVADPGAEAGEEPPLTDDGGNDSLLPLQDDDAEAGEPPAPGPDDETDGRTGIEAGDDDDDGAPFVDDPETEVSGNENGGEAESDDQTGSVPLIPASPVADPPVDEGDPATVADPDIPAADEIVVTPFPENPNPDPDSGFSRDPNSDSDPDPEADGALAGSSRQPVPTGILELTTHLYALPAVRR